MFTRRLVVESLRSQCKAACRTSLPSANKALLFSDSSHTTTTSLANGVRSISGTPVALSDQVMVSQTKGEDSKAAAAAAAAPKDDKVVVEACGDVDDNEDDSDDEEEMFVEAHESFEHNMAEWGGPRRGGRLPEPTRFGDWERKGRCTDF